METKITIAENGENIVRTLKVSALLPRLYRARFGRDLIGDMMKLEAAYKKAQKDEAGFSIIDLTIFEDLCWLMMKHAGEDVGESPEEWLDQVSGIFSIYEVMPEIISLWNAGQKTTAKPAKK